MSETAVAVQPPVPREPSPELVELERAFGPFLDLPVDVSILLGQTTVTVGDLLEIAPQSVITIPKSAGEDLEIYVNNKLIGRGAVIIIEEHFGVRITEIEKKICTT